MMREIIKLIDVVKIYKIGSESVYAVNGVSLNVSEGEFLCIMGASGSGKTTLLSLIGCLDRPTSGKVILDGIDTNKLSERELADVRREKLGFIFQQYHLIPTLTAFENVELPMLLKGVPKLERKRKIMKLLEIMGIAEAADRKPSELSGGMQQRVAIARALANDPEILLCDEPTGNLDTKSGEVVMRLIKEQNERGVTVVLVTHDPEIAKYAEKVVRIKDGKIIAEGLEAIY
ncbi:MAG: lipoprotein-releasing system ATP-binding protein LolD [Archaeoglobus sp.]|nr:MAG: lipoprotein-releasing system ATP-binding protein LolD [Archaeoglobus sp.]